MTDEKDQSSSKMVLRALDVLECVLENAEPISLTDIATTVNLPKATALRILQTLAERNYVLRDDVSKSFIPGPMLWPMQQPNVARQTLVTSVKPALEQLAAESGETAHVAVLDGQWITYLDVVEPISRIRAWLRPGETVPANCVASGKAILAFKAPAVVEAFLSNQLARTTDKSIISPEALRRSIDHSKRVGYGVVKGEWDRDLHAISVPIFGPTGDPVGAIGLSGPAMRMDDDRIENDLFPVLKAHSDKISKAFGYHAKRGEVVVKGRETASFQQLNIKNKWGIS